MKRICFLPVVLLLTGLLCGCTGQQQNDPSPQEHNHAMEEGTETPKYDHLTVYSPLPESETLLYCSASARIPASPWTVFIFLPEK